MGEKNSVSGIFEHQFRGDAFIGDFKYETIFDKTKLKILAEEYGLFCIVDNTDKKVYAWLPKNNSNVEESLPMKHIPTKIGEDHIALAVNNTRSRPYVNLYKYRIIDNYHNVYTLTMFKKKEYDALKAKISKKITKILTTPLALVGGRYTSKTLKELQVIAKARKLPFSGLKKTELIALLRKR